MKNLTAEEPDYLFPARRDAVLYLVGLGGFRIGLAMRRGMGRRALV